MQNPEVGRKTLATWGIVVGVIAIGLGIYGIVDVTEAVEDLGSGMIA